MSHGIIVGVDFSEPARRAFDHAVALAVRLERPLTVVHAWSPSSWAGVALPESVDWGSWIASAREDAERTLASWVESARERGAEATARFEEERASPVLLTLSGAADMIVVGRRGRADLAHVLLGSVCERVVTGASCPVLVVPLRSERPLLPRRVLVGVDYSAASSAALRRVAALRAALGMEQLVVAHASGNERDLWLASEPVAPERGRHRDRGALLRWALARVDPGDTVEPRVIQEAAESGLVALADEEECDWIALGVQGRTALAAFLIGSTTHRILKLTDRPVLTVPNPVPAAGEATS